MRKLLLASALALAALAGTLALTARPKPAYCASCSVPRCNGEYMCGYGCSCLYVGSGMGYCVAN